MNIKSIEEFREVRARKARARERALADAQLAEMAARSRREVRSIEHERARWRRRDYKPGRLAPDSTTQYTKTYKRDETVRAKQRRMQVRMDRATYHKLWQAADAEAKEQQRLARERWEAVKAAAACAPVLREENAALLVETSDDRMSLSECAEELRVPYCKAARILELYGAEVQDDGSYLRGQVMRAALVWRNEHPLLTGSHDGVYTYDEAAAFVGVSRCSIKHKARYERWPKMYELNEAVNQVCVYLRAVDVRRYKMEHDAWLNAGYSDHTHRLKRRQQRRNSPSKAKHR